MLDYEKTLIALTRRPAEHDGATLVAYFTSQRRLELTRETDGIVSVWAVAPIVIAGRLVEMAALVTRPDGTRVYLYASSELDSEMVRARFASFVRRNGIEVAETAADTKPRKSAKPKTAVVGSA
jgi:hypothetical protein